MLTLFATLDGDTLPVMRAIVAIVLLLNTNSITRSTFYFQGAEEGRIERWREIQHCSLNNLGMVT